jgi:threonine/homoserine/homoserine lactone efflux protein
MVSAAFVVTCVLVIVSPGPSLAVILDQTLRAGRWAGVATVAGNTSGLVLWAGASALGLTALVRTSEVAFLVLKIAGAVYLCRLGWQAVRRSFREVERPVARAGERPRGLGASYRAGLVANVSNPKAAVLYLALFPQFLPPDGGTLGDTAVLAGVQMAISASYYLLVVVAVDTVRRFLAKAPVRRAVERLTGFVLVGLGVRMLTLSRAAV